MAHEMPESMKPIATERLLTAVRIMREACDDAERAIKDKRNNDLEKIRRTIHTLTWGHANAVGGITSAINHVNDWS